MGVVILINVIILAWMFYLSMGMAFGEKDFGMFVVSILLFGLPLFVILFLSMNQ